VHDDIGLYLRQAADRLLIVIGIVEAVDRRAAGYLTTTNLTLYAIAQSTGYDSEASLGKAFKREFGQSPGDYRRERASSPIRIADVSATETASQTVTAAKNGWGWPVSA